MQIWAIYILYTQYITVYNTVHAQSSGDMDCRLCFASRLRIHIATRYSKVPSSKKAVIFHRDIFFFLFRELYSSNQSRRLVVAHLLERAELTATVKVAIDCRVSSEVFQKRPWFLPVFKDNDKRFFFAGGMFSLLFIHASSFQFAINRVQRGMRMCSE